jgi:hypothetical protein
MRLQKVSDEFFIVQNRYSDDDEINIAINCIIEAWEEVDEFADDDEYEEIYELIADYIDDFDIDDIAIKLIALSEDDLFDLFDELDEIGLFDDIDDEEEFYENLQERLVKKFVIRGGKKKKIKRTSRQGYTTRDGKEVRMGSKERRTRKISQRKASRKRRATMAKAVRKRTKSMKKRKAMISK